MSKLKAASVTALCMAFILACIGAICVVPPSRMIDGIVVITGLVVLALIVDFIYMLLQGMDNNE